MSHRPVPSDLGASEHQGPHNYHKYTKSPPAFISRMLQYCSLAASPSVIVFMNRKRFLAYFLQPMRRIRVQELAAAMPGSPSTLSAYVRGDFGFVFAQRTPASPSQTPSPGCCPPSVPARSRNVMQPATRDGGAHGSLVFAHTTEEALLAAAPVWFSPLILPLLFLRRVLRQWFLVSNLRSVPGLEVHALAVRALDEVHLGLRDLHELPTPADVFRYDVTPPSRGDAFAFYHFLHGVKVVRSLQPHHDLFSATKARHFSLAHRELQVGHNTP